MEDEPVEITKIAAHKCKDMEILKNYVKIYGDFNLNVLCKSNKIHKKRIKVI